MTVADQPGLILQLRLEALHKNLEQIQSIRTSVKRRRSEILRLRRYLVEDPTAEVLDEEPDAAGPPSTVFGEMTKLQFALSDIRASREALRRSGTAIEELTAKRLDQAISDAAEAFDQMEGRIDDINTIVRELYARWAEIREEWLSEAFLDVASRPMRELEGIRRAAGLLERDIDAATQAAAEEGAEPGPDLADAWRRYDQLYSEQLSDLFEGYVEVLGGLALRNVGADQGICRMADSLIDYWVLAGSTLGGSLTIPSRREATQRTLKRIIRLGFPEWSIWAIPLAAHEFAAVVLEQDASMLDEARAAAPAGVGDMLADIVVDSFATAIMGPAYACSMVILQLDPVAREEGVSLDHVRAEAVFATLDVLDATEMGMTAVRESLTGAWKLAVEQAKPSDEDAALPAGLDREALRPIAQVVVSFLSTRSRRLIFSSERWRDVCVAEGNGTRRRDTRDLLNRAWWQRMEGGNADTLAKQIDKEWRELNVSGSPPSSPGQGPGTGV